MPPPAALKVFAAFLRAEFDDPAGAGLTLQSATGRQALNAADEFVLALTPAAAAAPPAAALRDGLLKKGVRWWVDGVAFAGVVRGLSRAADGAAVVLRVTSRLGRLAHTGRDRTLLDKTAPEVLEAVAAGAGVTCDRTRLAADRYPKRPLWVQQHATDGAYFDHVARAAGVTAVPVVRGGQEVIVLTDRLPLPGDPAVLVPRAGGVPAVPGGRGWYDGLAETFADGPDGVTVRMHDPAAGRVAAATIGAGDQTPAATVDLGVVRSGDAKQVRRAAEAVVAGLAAAGAAAEFTTDAVLTPGAAVTLAGDARVWVVRAVSHSAHPDGYTGTVTVHPADQPYVPPPAGRLTVAGYLPARVVGADGQPTPAGAAHATADGSVLVRFHFDAPDAPPARVAVAPGGAGRLELPRVGDEVAVLFQDGDPTQPLVVGGLPVPAAGLPHPHAAHPGAASAVVRPATGADPAEATRFHADPRPGKQRLIAYLPGELAATVRQAVRWAVGGAAHLSVGGDVRAAAGGSLLARVAKNLVLKVAGAVGVEVAGEVVVKARKVTIAGDQGVDIVCGGSTVSLTPGLLKLLAGLVDINPPGGSAPKLGDVPAADAPDAPPAAL